MKLIHTKLLKENKFYILENMRQAKQLVDANRLSSEDLTSLINIDPTSQKKYVGWMAKIWVTEKPDIDDLRNTIEEFDTLLNKGKINIKDINSFKDFKSLFDEVDTVNNSGEGTNVTELERDYDTVLDNADLLIMSPHTHEASRKLGLSFFSFRDCGDGGKDSSWCTTYKAPDHFNSYYYTNNVTFYYVKIKSQNLIDKLKATFPSRYKNLIVVALAVLDGGGIDGYDGLDKQINSKDVKLFTDIIGIS